MKAILSMLAFFCFAAMFGIALISTKWYERLETKRIDDEAGPN